MMDLLWGVGGVMLILLMTESVLKIFHLLLPFTPLFQRAFKNYREVKYLWLKKS